MIEIKCCICGIFEIIQDYRRLKWATHKCDKIDCTGYLCFRCYQKYDPRSQGSAKKSVTHIRNNQLYKYISSGRGLIGEACIAKVRKLDIISIKFDSYNTRFDLSIDPEHGIIQSKLKVPWYGDWYAHFGGEHYFDTLFFQCANKSMTNIDRIYAIPEYELHDIKTISIYRKPSKPSKWNEFRIDEKPYNDAYHSLILYLKDKKYFGVEDIKKWLIID